MLKNLIRWNQCLGTSGKKVTDYSTHIPHGKFESQQLHFQCSSLVIQLRKQQVIACALGSLHPCGTPERNFGHLGSKPLGARPVSSLPLSPSPYSLLTFLSFSPCPLLSLHLCLSNKKIQLDITKEDFDSFEKHKDLILGGEIAVYTILEE